VRWGELLLSLPDLPQIQAGCREWARKKDEEAAAAAGRPKRSPVYSPKINPSPFLRPLFSFSPDIRLLRCVGCSALLGDRAHVT
jgi:hypothetical protein